MERFLDEIWESLHATVLFLAQSLDALLSPLHTVTSPAVVIFLLAAVTVCSTKFLSKVCRTQRHIRLEKEFKHWLTIREEALRCEDPEKGARMARNIDQAKLNRCYYDYFFEGFLLSLITTYVPILLVLSYVNTFYRPERLMALTGKDYIMRFDSSSGDPLLIGSVFFFFLSLLSLYLSWAILKRIGARINKRKRVNEEEQTPAPHDQVKTKRFFLAEELK